MFTTQQYVVASSLDEAYALNQKPRATVLGGCGWLKMGRRAIGMAIDLSALGLDRIEEFDDRFELGAMVTLRQIETSEALAAAFGPCLRESVRHIVGVQFRNCATIGGSIWGRFGFSDPLTCLTALGASVRLHHAGLVPLSEFIRMDYDRDLLVAVVLPKAGQRAVYLTHRATQTDFPVLAAAVCRRADGTYCAAVGARPQRAALVEDTEGLLAGGVTDASARAFADFTAGRLTFSSNLRGSAEFRRHLCRVLVRRAAIQLEEGQA